jgi:hypothetical protein
MGWLSRVFYGVDTDETQEREDYVNAQTALLNQKKLEQGSFTDAEYERAEQTRRDNYVSDVDAEIRNAFNTELDSRAASFRDFTGDAVGAVVGTPFKLIPWQIWLIAVGVVVWKLGLLDGILSKVRR